MYRQGLGDCFLLTFAPESKQPFHLLIDCGVIIGTPDATEKMKQVATHIAQTVGDAGIDVLVATHEHWDHISGFAQAREEFDKISIKNVWLAWTEDPKNPTARQLRAERAAKLAKVQAAALALQNRGGLDADATLGEVVPLLGFFGIESIDTPATSATGTALAAAGTTPASGGNSTAAAMNWLQDRKPRYLKPGHSETFAAGKSTIRVYVLGPPTNLKQLRKDQPSKSGHETYELALGDQALFSAFSSSNDDPDEFVPFRDDRNLEISFENAKDVPFFRANYFGTPPMTSSPPAESDDDRETGGPVDDDLAWRRIDGVWMQALSRFALQLDSDTNNTSLALAIELPNDDVLLFPGDAQVGNWESWRDLTWKVGDESVTMDELFRRTVLYKVGHHGSHNATLRENGLERMTHPNLVAMLPVDERLAHEKKKWTHMPLPSLIERLKEKTKQRILRSDEQQSLTGANVVVANEFLAKDPNDQPLYVDYFIA